MYGYHGYFCARCSLIHDHKSVRMNMKLLSGLAVVVALTSSMMFLGIYAKGIQAPAPKAADALDTTAPTSFNSTGKVNPTSVVSTSVKVDGDVAKTSVTIKK